MAYRMLGYLGRAKDVVQDAWGKWQRREAVGETPKAYLIKIVTRSASYELGYCTGSSTSTTASWRTRSSRRAGNS
jgi:hypothetical protein